MGWGELPNASSDRQLDAADHLADALWEWQEHRSTGNEEKVIVALRRYERIRNRPTKGFLGC